MKNIISASTVNKVVALLFVSGFAFLPTVIYSNAAAESGVPPKLAASDVLSARLLSSENHRVLDEIQYDGQYFQFELETDYGTETVTSRALLKLRIHEAIAIAQASRAIHQNAREKKLNKSAFTRQFDQSNLAGDDPGAKVEYPQFRFTGKKKKSLDKAGSTEQSGFYPPEKQDHIFYSHKRAVAARLQMDVYSTNPAAQDIMEQLAQARVGGKMPMGAAFILERDPETILSKGLVDADVRRALKDYAPDELRQMNDEILGKLGISVTARRQFLSHAAFSPRHATYITAYLQKMKNVKGRDVFLDALLGADTEVHAIQFEQLARMLAVYNEQVEALDNMSMIGSILVVHTTGNTLLVAQPVDILYQPNNIISLGDALNYPTKGARPRGKELIVTGIVTATSRKRLEDRGFKIRENFLSRQ
ncbi:MAG: hypothetical protein OQL16_10095 [Gammaproteobacteria bacterium]|nr:hypothetical protein [Gammaproteobacteria bacterium]